MNVLVQSSPLKEAERTMTKGKQSERMEGVGLKKKKFECIIKKNVDTTGATDLDGVGQAPARSGAPNNPVNHDT